MKIIVSKLKTDENQTKNNCKGYKEIREDKLKWEVKALIKIAIGCT